jgi:uncharacterized ion transporter superfamily protein YfcC
MADQSNQASLELIGAEGTTQADPQTAREAAPAAGARKRGGHGALDPVLMMLVVLALAIGLTWIVPSGAFVRKDHNVVPGTYHVVPKALAPEYLLDSPASSDTAAYPAGITALVTAQPAGMKQSAGLIFMIMFLGGMFGVLRASGALEAAIDRLVAATGGRVAILVPVLMIAISAGSAFLGLISEYLLIIPIMLALADRLGRSALFGLAIVAVAAKIGYLASVANPVALVIAQPIVGVPVFSGWQLRLALWVGLLTLGVLYVLRLARREHPTGAPVAHIAPRLAPRQLAIVVALGLAVVVIVIGSTRFGWKDEAFGAFYIALGALIAALAGMRPVAAAHAFIDGMKSMMLAALLVGMAAAVEIVLRDGRVLDTIINALSGLASDKPPYLVGQALMGIEMVLTVLIPSTSAKAALSMPILGPIAQLNGVTGQSTVLAFLLGNGLMNMLSPTSGMLLAYLATGAVGYGAWARFILPLWIGLAVICFVVIALAAAMGYA